MRVRHGAAAVTAIGVFEKPLATRWEGEHTAQKSEDLLEVWCPSWVTTDSEERALRSFQRQVYSLLRIYSLFCLVPGQVPAPTQSYRNEYVLRRSSRDLGRALLRVTVAASP